MFDSPTSENPTTVNPTTVNLTTVIKSRKLFSPARMEYLLHFTSTSCSPRHLYTPGHSVI